MTRIFINLIPILLLANFVFAGRTPANYDSSGNDEKDGQICLSRYNDELSFTKKLVQNCDDEKINSLVELTNRMLKENSPNLEAIADTYKELMNRLSGCRFKQITGGPHDVSQLQADFGASKDVRNKLFLHVLGDVFGKKSGLEGSSGIIMLQHRLRQLKVLRAKIGNNIFIADLDHVAPCYRLEIVNQSMYADNPYPDIPLEIIDDLIKQTELSIELAKSADAPSFVTFRDKLAITLGNLKTGESVLFPWAWTKHAIAFELMREDEKHVTFRIFNSGEGISAYHAASLTGHEIKYFPFVEVIHVPIENFSSLVIIRALIEIYSPVKGTTGAKDLYEYFLPILGGERNPIPYGADLFADPQRSGTCGYRSLEFVASSYVSRKAKDLSSGQQQQLAARIEYLLSFLTLRDYGLVFNADPTLQADEESRNLLKKGLNYFSAASSDAFDQHIASYGELTPVVENIRETKSILNNVEQIIANKDRKDALQFVFSTPVQTPFSAVPGIPAMKDLNGAKEMLEAGKSKLQIKVPLLFHVEIANDLPSNKDELIKTMTDYYEKLESGLAGEYYTNIAHYIAEISKMLLLETTFWNGINNDQALATISLLQKFDELYLFCFLKDISRRSLPEMQLSGVQLLIAVKLLTVADFINKNYITSINPKFPSLYSETFGSFLYGNSAVFSLADPQSHKQFSILRDYYSKNRFDDPLLDFEQFPAGANYARRIFDDETAGELIDKFLKKKKKWEDEHFWNDIDWMTKVIQGKSKTDGYDRWYKTASAHEKVSDTEFYWSPFTPPDVAPEKPVSRKTEDLLARRAAIRLVGNDRGEGAHKFTTQETKLFYSMRSLAIIADYLLTGNIAQATFEACTISDYKSGIKYITTSGSLPLERAVKSDGQASLVNKTVFDYFTLELNIFNTNITKDNQHYRTGLKYVDFPDKTVLFYYRHPFFHFAQSSGLFNFTEQGAYKSKYQRDEILATFNQAYVNKEFDRFRNINPDHKRISPNEVTETNPKAENLVALGLERMRAIYNLSAVPDLQLDSTLSYFSGKRDLFALGNDSYRMLFEKLMFEPTLLSNEFRHNQNHAKAFAKHLSKFCTDVYEYFKKSNDYRAMAFILRMNDLFKLHANYANVNDVNFLDSPNELLNLIKTLNPEQTQEKSFLYRNIAQIFAYHDKLSIDDVKLILLSKIEHNTIKTIDDIWTDQKAGNEIRNLLREKQDNISTILQSNSNDIFNTVMNIMRPELGEGLKNSAWVRLEDKTGAIFQASVGEKTFYINIAQGTLYEEGNAIVALPVATADFKKIFGNATRPPTTVRQIAIGIYEWTDPVTTNLIRAQVSEWGHATYQRQIHGKWFHLLNDRFYGAMKASKSIMPTMHNWLEVSLVDNPNLEIYVTSPTSGEITYNGQLKNARDLESVSRPQDQRMLVNTEGRSEFDVFKSIEAERHIYVWQYDKDKNDIEVSLPRLGLTFKTLKNANALDCASWLDYKLAKEQYVFALGLPINYIVCEPRDTTSEKPKIAITVEQELQLKTKEKALLASNFDSKREADNFDKNLSGDLLVYRINSSKLTLSDELAIEPESLAAKYYLTLRYLWQQKYRLAKNLAMAQSSEFASLTKQEKSILGLILEGNKDDHDVRAFATRLNALYLLGKNFFYYEHAPILRYAHRGDRVSELAEIAIKNRPLYDKYLSSLNTAGSGWIDYKIELTLAKWFMHKVTTDREYYKTITPLELKDQRLANRLTYLQNYANQADIATQYVEPQIFEPETYKEVNKQKQHANRDVLEEFLTQGSESKMEEGVLKVSASFLSPKTLGLFYQAAIGAKLSNEEKKVALEILNLALGVEAKVDTLDDYQIRKELIWIVKFATLQPSAIDDRDAQLEKTARYLEEVASLAPSDKAKLTEMEWDTPGKLSLRKFLRSEYAEKDDSTALEIFAGALSKFAKIEEPSPIATRAEQKVHQKLPKGKRRTEPATFAHGQPSAITDPLGKPILSDDDFNNIFSETSLSDTDKLEIVTHSMKINLKLRNAILSQNVSSDIKNGVNTLAKRISSKSTDIRNTTKYFAIKDAINLNKLKDDLDKKIASLNSEIQFKQNSILNLARKYEPNRKDANYNELLQLADIEKQVEINDLIYLFLTNKLELFYKVNGSITPEEAVMLRNWIVDYLAHTTYAVHLAKYIEAIGSIVMPGKAGIQSDSDLQLLLARAINLGKTTRSYLISEHPEYLVFEHFMEILIRKNQKDALDTLSIKDGHLSTDVNLGKAIELIMGAGKTSVILPLLCALNTGGDSLNVVVLPESLITSMSKDLAQQLHKSFQKYIDVMIFGGERELNIWTVPVLRERFERAKRENRTIVTTNSSLQNLFLSLIKLLDEGDSDKYRDVNRIEDLKAIFSIFRESGNLTIDEVDLALDVMRAVQIAAGKRIAIPGVLKDTVSSLYKLIASNADIYKSFTMPFIPYSSGTALNDSSYKNLKAKIIEQLLTLDKNGNSFLKSRRGLDKIYVDYVNKFHTVLKSYWEKPTTDSRKIVMAGISDDSLKDVLAIIAEELNGALELTINKKLNIHYGVLPAPTNELEKGEYDKSKFIAIPYHNGSPMVQSRFASAIEAVNYTIQKDLALQNFEDYIKFELEQLKRLGSGNPAFLVRYEKLMGDEAKTDINNLSNAQIKKVADGYRGVAKSNEQMKLIEAYALKQISSYEKQLQTNAQIYEFLFKRIQGFSGTLWSEKTFPDLFSDVELSETSPLTILTLMASDASVLTLSLDPHLRDDDKRLDALVKQIYANWKTPGSFIDEAGIFRAFSNKKVATAILSNIDSDDVEGIVFYDESDDIVVIDKSFNIVPLARTSIPINKRVALWDRQHTTGSDIKLRSRMQAKMSIDMHAKIRDVEQASWRLRGLATGQKIVEYVVFEDDLKTIKEKLSTKYKLYIEKVTQSDLIAYFVLNQEEQLGMLKWRAFSQRLKNQIVKIAVDKIMSAKKPDFSVNFYNLARDLFAKGEPEHLYEVYGFPVEQLDKESAINNELNSLKTLSSYESFKELGRLDDNFNRIIKKHKSNLPDSVMMPLFSIQGTEVQVELNLQMQTQTQTQTQTAQYDPSKTPPQYKFKKWELEQYGEKVFTYDFIKNHKLKNSTHTIPASKNPLNPLFTALDEHIYFSNNYAPFNDKNFELFDQFGKQIIDMLVIYYREKNEYDLVILDLDDAKEWKSFLLNCRDQKHQEIGISVYDLQSNEFSAQQSGKEFDAALGQKDQSFLTLLVQVKFLAGILNYSEAEKRELAQWIKKSGDIEALRQIFISNILQFKDDTAKDYGNSFIAELFGDQI